MIVLKCQNFPKCDLASVLFYAFQYQGHDHDILTDAFWESSVDRFEPCFLTPLDMLSRAGRIFAKCPEQRTVHCLDHEAAFLPKASTASKPIKHTPPCLLDTENHCVWRQEPSLTPSQCVLSSPPEPLVTPGPFFRLLLTFLLASFAKKTAKGQKNCFLQKEWIIFALLLPQLYKIVLKEYQYSSYNNSILALIIFLNMNFFSIFLLYYFFAYTSKKD